MGNPNGIEPEREERETAIVVAGVLGAPVAEYLAAEDETRLALCAAALSRLAAMATGCLAASRPWSEIPRIRVFAGDVAEDGADGSGGAVLVFDALAELVREAVAEGELDEAEAAEIRGAAGDGDRILDLGAGSPRAFLDSLAVIDEMGDEARGVPGVAVA